MSKRVIDMTADELGDLIEARSRAKPVEHRPWLSVPQACSQYAIGRKLVLRLIERGVLPATMRPTQGGKGWFVRADDAERILAATK
jgi:hypothetical protein